MPVTWLKKWQNRTRFSQMVVKLMDEGCTHAEAEVIACKRLREEEELHRGDS